MTAIDISYWQHHPDFAQVHGAGVTLVIMKCGGGEAGRLYEDSVYADNRSAARAQGLAVGSYFFNGPVDPVAAADFQFSVIDWQPGDVVAIDVEGNGVQPRWNPSQVFAWCQRILAHGVPAGRILVYMSSSVLGAGWDAVAGLGVGLWVAQYGPNDGNAHSVPGSGPWSSWVLWQFTSRGTVPGIAGSIDMNQVSPTFASSGETIVTAGTGTPAPFQTKRKKKNKMADIIVAPNQSCAYVIVRPDGGMGKAQITNPAVIAQEAAAGNFTIPVSQNTYDAYATL